MKNIKYGENLSHISEDCFCAFCKEPRRVYAKKHVTLVNFFMSFLTAGLLTLVLFQGVDPRFIFLFVVCLIFSEIFIQVRWRLSIACPRCGFNPLLYVKNPEIAAQKVNDFFDRKMQDPAFILTRNPLVKVALQSAKSKNNKGKFKLADPQARGEELPQKNSGQILSKTL